MVINQIFVTMRKLIFNLNYYLFQLLFFRMCFTLEKGKIKYVGFLFPILPFTGWSDNNPYKTFIPKDKVWIFWPREMKLEVDKVEK